MKILPCLLHFALLLLLAAAFTRPLRAHDILLLPDADGTGLTIKYGHPGDYTLPDREKLFVLNAYPAGGATPYSLLSAVGPGSADTLTLKLDRAVFAGPGVTVVGAGFDNGYFVEMDKEQYFNTSRREMPAAKKSGHYLKAAKALLPPTAADHTGFDRVLGYRLELVPKQDPFTLRVGDELAVLVLFEGRPFAGAEVDVISGEFPVTKDMELPKFKTDANGITRVKIERPGLQSLGTDRTVAPSTDPQLADEDNFASTLSFRLPAEF